MSITEGLPCRIYSLVTDTPTLRTYATKANLGVAVIARKISQPAPDLNWNVRVKDLTETMYPEK